MGNIASGIVGTFIGSRNVFDVKLYGLDNFGKTLFAHHIADLNNQNNNRLSMHNISWTKSNKT
jgi:hypothetical protein